MKQYLSVFFVFWALTCKSQIIATVAGIGVYGQSGMNGLAVNAEIKHPCAITFDKNGNYYFSTFENVIYKVDTSGIINVFAGTGIAGFSGDGGAALSAQLNNPTGLAFDDSGNLFIADSYNNRIRRIDAVTNVITTIAGNGIGGFSGDGGQAINSELNGPYDLCFNKNGELFIADCANYRIRAIDTSGIIVTVAGNGGTVFNGEGGLATSASIFGVLGMCIDANGALYLAARGVSRVLKIDTSGILTTIAGSGLGFNTGDGGLATMAQVCPEKLAFDTYGNLYISCIYKHCIRRINTNGIIQTVVGIDSIAGYSGDESLAINARLDEPIGIAFDSCGNLLIADDMNFRIRKVTFNTKCAPENVTEISPNTYTFYPNPADDELIIESSAISNDVGIYDILGKELLTKHVISKKTSIDVAKLMKGVYFLKINDMPIQKFIKD